MSWGVRIKAIREIDLYHRGITYNVNDMLKYAFETERHLKNLNGMPCEKAIPILEKAYQKMLANPDECRKYDSPNGWGTYENTIKAVEMFLTIAKDNPDGVFEVD